MHRFPIETFFRPPSHATLNDPHTAMPFKPSTALPCPRDNLIPASNPAPSFSATTSFYNSRTTSNPHVGAHVSLLATTQLSASSPSLIGQYWGRTAGSKPSFNAGVTDWNGLGTWTRAERNTLELTGASNIAPGQNWEDRLARKRNAVTQNGNSTTFGVLGHQEDSHLDRLEKQHRAMPGPADNYVGDIGGYASGQASNKRSSNNNIQSMLAYKKSLLHTKSRVFKQIKAIQKKKRYRHALLFF